MFSRILPVFVVACCLVQPNEAFFGLDSAIAGGIVATIASDANTVNNATQNKTSTDMAYIDAFFGSQVQDSLNEQVFTIFNNYLLNMTGATQSVVNSCGENNIANISALWDSTIADVMNTCLLGNTSLITSVLNLAANISVTSRNLTGTVANFNLSAACPGPDGGDLLGNLVWPFSKPLCLKSAVMSFAGYVGARRAQISANEAALDNLMSTLTPLASAYPACSAPIVNAYQNVGMIPVANQTIPCIMTSMG